jgi:hypothetical protein
LRSDIVWSKPNPMPESVTDRPTKAHEYVFLLTRSPRYYYDADAVREAHATAATDKRSARSTYDANIGESWHNHEADLQRGQRVEAGKVAFHPAGRNIRSVWEIATQPYPEAHFATFPEALPDRCIRAGTSECGCCRVCGAPWEREVEREVVNAQETNNSDPNSPLGWDRDRTHPRASIAVTTLGWCPMCSCDGVTDGHPERLGAGDRVLPVPCTVLDPFMGSGTTALVARRLGRRSIGIELNPEYAQLCARRLQQLSLFAEAP